MNDPSVDRWWILGAARKLDAGDVLLDALARTETAAHSTAACLGRPEREGPVCRVCGRLNRQMVGAIRVLLRRSGGLP